MPIILGTLTGVGFGLIFMMFGLGAALIVLPLLGMVLGAVVMWTYRDSAMEHRTPEQVEETLKRDRARWGVK